jgi:hypothetical protein
LLNGDLAISHGDKLWGSSGIRQPCLLEMFQSDPSVAEYMRKLLAPSSMVASGVSK